MILPCWSYILIILSQVNTSFNLTEMASIPHSLAMARSRKKKNTREGSGKSANNYVFMEDKAQMLCYNKKLMDSIWGQYNKYSVHNLKSVQGDDFEYAEPGEVFGFPNQQPISSVGGQQLTQEFSAYAGQKLNTLGHTVLDNVFKSVKL